jgi:recombinational DNA repair ATPase RecF
LKNQLFQSELTLWSKEVSALGLDLSIEQYKFFQFFKESVKEYINTVTDTGSFPFLKEVDVTFSKGWERSKKLDASLKDCMDRDKALGYTSKGPHRMDFTFNIKGKKASSNLSRGQILMIDDLGSELDSKNLSGLLEEILKIDGQIILTGIEGEEMHGSLKKLVNFTQINL